jgi:hypothetical protein
MRRRPLEYVYNIREVVRDMRAKTPSLKAAFYLGSDHGVVLYDQYRVHAYVSLKQI